MKKNFNGIWFYGISGSGKSFASKYLNKIKKNSIIIDGDFVRKHISFDLNYSIKHRCIQCERVLGISKLVLNSGYFPIISTSYLSKETFTKLKKNKIKPVKIFRDLNLCKKYGKAFKKNKKNLIGFDIEQQVFDTLSINNKNKKSLFKELRRLNEKN